MSTILAYTSPAIGHLFPMTPVLLELQNRGHQVHVRTLASKVGLMRDLGFTAVALDPRVEAISHDDYLVRGPRRGLAAAAQTFAARGRFDAPAFKAAVDDVRPDAALVDINAWGACFAAEAWGGPWASFSPYIPVLHSPGTPPFGPGVPPLGGVAGRVRDAALRRLVLGAVEGALTPGINALRADVGLPPVASAEEFLRKAPLMLVTTAKPFEYAATDWGPGVVMIGASAWDPPQKNEDWLDAIRQPILLVTTSSEFQGDGVLVRTALEAFRDEPVHVVATMPAGVAAGMDIPANATVKAFLPHNAVLDRAAVALTHGGMGATQKALAHGVPVCVVPFGRDQLEVARRVQVSGSGTRLPRRRLSPARLRKSVAAAMAMRTGAGRVAEGFRAAGGAVAAADAIESHLLSASAGPVR
ncbi:glycosyltransferase [Pseudarthrobacter sp. YS3]|uniref:glycosyltransferase n=1 Tax=Pseudarthrobacter sp. YS3 TaxID=3453718 RepID=UPI003EE9FFF4